MLLESENLLKSALPLYRGYLKYISADIINLEELEKSGIKYLKVRKEIEAKLKNLFSLNSESKELHELAFTFIEFFDFKERSIKDFTKVSYQRRS